MDESSRNCSSYSRKVRLLLLLLRRLPAKQPHITQQIFRALFNFFQCNLWQWLYTVHFLAFSLYIFDCIVYSQIGYMQCVLHTKIIYFVTLFGHCT